MELTCTYCKRAFTRESPRGRQGGNTFCKTSCKNNFYVTQNRRATKEKAIAHLGGACERCGWNEHQAGLQFHHRDPTQKKFKLSSGSFSWDRVKREIEKCSLLCGNCHAVVHATDDPEWIGIPG